MYKTGELEEVMKSFEKALKDMPTVFTGSGNLDKSDKVEVEIESGRFSKRYRNNRYYNNGNINQLFIAFLWGYAAGKATNY